MLDPSTAQRFIEQAPSIAAIVFIVYMFVGYIRTRDKESIQERREMRDFISDLAKQYDLNQKAAQDTFNEMTKRLRR